MDKPHLAVRLVGNGVGYLFSFGGALYTVGQVFAVWSRSSGRLSTLTDAAGLSGALVGLLWGTIVTGIGALVLVGNALLLKAYDIESRLNRRDEPEVSSERRSLRDIKPLRKLD